MGFILLFDLTNEDSFLDVTNWLFQLKVRIIINVDSFSSVTGNFVVHSTPKFVKMCGKLSLQLARNLHEKHARLS